jgi:hypothetical protein
MLGITTQECLFIIRFFFVKKTDNTALRELLNPQKRRGTPKKSLFFRYQNCPLKSGGASEDIC